MPELDDYKNIRAMRRSMTPRVSQRELAERAGIDRPTLSFIESGKSVPRISTVQRLFSALDLLRGERQQQQAT